MKSGGSPLLGNRGVIDATKASRLPLRPVGDPVLFGLGPPLVDFAWE